MSRAAGGFRLALRAAALGSACLCVAMGAACIIAEPVSDLPRLPSFRPIIVRSSVVPPPSAVLGNFPEKFVIPVELVDPSVPIAWRLYIDYNPITGEGLREFKDPPADGGVNPATLQRVRLLEISTLPPSDLSRCHVVEFLVAQSFLGNAELEGKAAHSPREPPGGDGVTWFYSPTGDLRGCPVADAGVVGGGDAGVDGDVGGS